MFVGSLYPDVISIFGVYQLCFMQIDVNVYRDDFTLFPDGIVKTIPTDFKVCDYGDISLVDAYSGVVDYSRPFKRVLKLQMSNGSILYVSQTKEEIQALLTQPLNPALKTQRQTFIVDGVGSLAISSGVIVAMPSIVPDNARILSMKLDGQNIELSKVPYTAPRTYDFSYLGPQGLPSSTPKAELEVVWEP